MQKCLKLSTTDAGQLTRLERAHYAHPCEQVDYASSEAARTERRVQLHPGPFMPQMPVISESHWEVRAFKEKHFCWADSVSAAIARCPLVEFDVEHHICMRPSMLELCVWCSWLAQDAHGLLASLPEHQ